LHFPLLHVDTTWKFREMMAFRDETARRLGVKMIVHVNQDGIACNINPFSSGSQLCTHVMKTEALKQALTRHGFGRRQVDRCQHRRAASQRARLPHHAARRRQRPARAQPRPRVHRGKTPLSAAPVADPVGDKDEHPTKIKQLRTTAKYFM
jgi:3'-phosphoadenosine 5'-phosphosulfate sulfotransferase (PAPS reductase)/FAD synthetase